MSDATQNQIKPQDLLKRVPNSAMRLGAVALAVICMFAPMASVTSFGISVPMALTHAQGLGASAWLIVAVFIAAVVAPAADTTRPFMKLLDTGAAIMTFCVVLWLGYEYWKGAEQVAQAQNLASMMTGMRGGVPQMVGVSLSFGVAPLLGLLGLSAWTALRGRA